MDALEQKITTLKEVSHEVVHIQDLAPLFDQLSDSKLVLLGEASHGTHDYYTWRTEISKHLIENHGFNFIAIGFEPLFNVPTKCIVLFKKVLGRFSILCNDATNSPTAP